MEYENKIISNVDKCNIRRNTEKKSVMYHGNSEEI